MASIRPGLLRTEYLINPLGIDQRRPRLSWIVEPAHETGRGLKQAAYQIVVATSLHRAAMGEGDLWDSQMISSADSCHVEYGGRPLRSTERAWWTVRLWDEQGGVSNVARLAWFEMGLLERSDWSAMWAIPTVPGNSNAGLIRKQFDVSKPIARARLYVTALGLYVPFINGRRIGDDFFRPGWTDYRKRIQYQTYDVTGSLRAGSNAIGFAVGEGWYCGELGWSGREQYGKKKHLLAQLMIEYSDGSGATICTDGTWRCAMGPIISSSFLQGEVYDAREAIPGWCDAQLDDSSWGAADTAPLNGADLPWAPLVARPGPAVKKVAEIKPVSIKPVAGGRWIFDFGQNLVGFARLKVRGEAGRTIVLRFGEMLNPDGSLYVTNLRTARSTEYYTLAGGEEETYEPTFTFHGFRYAEISGYPAEPGAEALTAIVLSSDTPAAGSFECSSPMVSRLQQNIEWGQRGNFLEVPTDCPQRNERLGWMGDAQVFVRTATYNADVAAFFTKWMWDVIDAQSPAGAFSNVSPRVCDPSDGAPAWADAGVICPWTIYRVYGDKRLLETHYEAMRKYVDLLHAVNPDGIWAKLRHHDYGDWLSIAADTPKDVLATAYLAQSTQLVADSARVLGRVMDAQRYSDRAAHVRRAFCEKFVSDDGTITGDTQTAYVLALSFGLLPEATRSNAIQRLIDAIEKKNWHLSTGFLGVGHLLPTLTAAGRVDVAYRLLNNETFPSWGYSIRHGATTIWERWDGWTADKGFQTPQMNSFNHYALGSVGEWLYRTVAGIDLDGDIAGFSKVLLRPRPGGGLTWAKARYDSIRGRIESAWRSDGDAWHWDVALPPNTTATVSLLTGDRTLRESGEPIEKAPGVGDVQRTGEETTFSLEAGKYSFEAR